MPSYRCRFCGDSFEAAPQPYVWCYACGGANDASDMLDEQLTLEAEPATRFVADPFAPERQAA